MGVAQASEKRIQQGIDEIFNVEEYPKFLTFASSFLGFSFKNIVMMYMQAPDARYVAGFNAWKQLTAEQIQLNTIPVLVLYPEKMDTGGFEYTVRKVFDAPGPKTSERPIPFDALSGKCELTKCYSCFKEVFKDETKITVYPSDAGDEIERNGNAVMIPQKISDPDKFRMLLQFYLGLTQEHGRNKMISGSILNSALYIILSYYGMDTRRITFPYIKLPAIDRKVREDILMSSLRSAQKITAGIDSLYLSHLKSDQREKGELEK